MRVTFQRLTEVMQLHQAKLIDEVGIIPEHDDQDISAKDLTYYLSEASPLFSKWLKERGLFLEEDAINFDPDKFEEISRMCDAIIAEYDDEDDKPLWEDFNLRGDDDVDYNGGYIQIAMDALRICFLPAPVTAVVSMRGELDLPPGLRLGDLMQGEWPQDITIGEFRRAMPVQLKLNEEFGKQVFVFIVDEHDAPYPDTMTLLELRNLAARGITFRIIIDDKEGGAPAQVPEKVH